ncbi:MAG: hypothetical protein JWM89_1122 [Acidimicrobiales bacterium]|nr:hypothetical protein [Acidimicrobiales bacterium]
MSLPYARPVAVTAPEELEFDEDDLTPVVAEMAALAGAAAGWINFLPAVEEGHELPPRNFIAAIFSSRGEAVPLSTWSAPATPGGRATVGIEHGSGPKALARLAEQQLVLPAGWVKVADHPRRGLVVTAPGGADHAEVLWWLLAAAHALSVPPLTGDWLARIYRP